MSPRRFPNRSSVQIGVQFITRLIRENHAVDVSMGLLETPSWIIVLERVVIMEDLFSVLTRAELFQTYENKLVAVFISQAKHACLNSIANKLKRLQVEKHNLLLYLNIPSLQIDSSHLVSG